MHSRTIPVAGEGLTMEVHVYAILLTNAKEDVAGYMHLVRCIFRSFAKDLEFPLSFSNLSIDTFMVDTGFDTKI